MPYERCIETWAREEGIALTPGAGDGEPGEPGDRCKYILMKLPEIEAFWRLRDVNTY